MPTTSLLRTCLGLLVAVLLESLVSVDASRTVTNTAFVPSQFGARSTRALGGPGSTAGSPLSPRIELPIEQRQLRLAATNTPRDPLMVGNPDASKNSKNALAPLAMTVSADLDLTPVAFETSLETDAGSTAVTTNTNADTADIRLPLYQLALAGSFTTFFADISMHPMDCIKTVQQSDSGVGLSLFLAAQYLWTTSGIAGFYHGFLTYAGADAVGGALKFSVWELWKQTTVDKRPTYLYMWMGATLAFVSSSFVIVPGELVKQQLQMSHYDGLLEAVHGIYSQSGLPGFFVGYEGVFYRDVPYTIFELGLYDVFKGQIDARRPAEQEPAAWEEIMAAFATGAITAVLTTPLDTVKTKLMVDDYGGVSFIDCFSLTVQNHGWTAVFAGVVARVAWIVPFTAFYLPTYDFLKRQLLKRHIQTQEIPTEE